MSAWLLLLACQGVPGVSEPPPAPHCLDPGTGQRGPCASDEVRLEPAPGVPATEPSPQVDIRRPALRSCYEQALARDPTLAGRLEIEAQVVAGEVQQAHVRGDLADPEMRRCIQTVVLTWRAPSSWSGTVQAAFTFVFATD